MTGLAGKVLSILVWRTVSNRGSYTARDSTWREKRDNSIPAQFQTLLNSGICSSRIGPHSHRQTHVNLFNLI